MVAALYDVRAECQEPECSSYWDLGAWFSDQGTIVAEKVIGDGDSFDTVVPVLRTNSFRAAPLEGQQIAALCPECTDRARNPPVAGVVTRHVIRVRGIRA